MAILNSRLYVIIDPLNLKISPSSLARQVLAAGASLLQLRWKTATTADLLAEASAIASLARRAGACLIVNDRADIALAAGASGVHLGQEDLPPEAARSILGPSRIIGFSTHNTEQVTDANSRPVDYIGFGPIFPTSSKAGADPAQGLKGLRSARSLTDKPIVAIGGVNEGNMCRVFAAGANAVAILSDITRAGDITAKVKRMLAALTSV